MFSEHRRPSPLSFLSPSPLSLPFTASAASASCTSMESEFCWLLSLSSMTRRCCRACCRGGAGAARGGCWEGGRGHAALFSFLLNMPLFVIFLYRRPFRNVYLYSCTCHADSACLSLRFLPKHITRRHYFNCSESNCLFFFLILLSVFLLLPLFWNTRI